ncbi:MAG: hypothetical protein LBS84_03320 [Clostridiales bacterium]|jgi:hypothetical protein|nr:hypothetical protein [Clostridiales bacterium]
MNATRTRKVKISDNTGREAQFEVSDSETVNYIENLYSEMSNLNTTNRTLFTDPAGGRVLSDRNRKVSELFPGLGEIHILVLPDTVNA